jgi:hypothetical protein
MFSTSVYFIAQRPNFSVEPHEYWLKWQNVTRYVGAVIVYKIVVSIIIAFLSISNRCFIISNELFFYHLFTSVFITRITSVISYH